MREQSALSSSTNVESAAERAEVILRESQQAIWKRTDHLFAGLLAFEWLGAIVLALWRSPRTWDGTVSHVHPHVWAAIFVGAAIVSLPIFLAMIRPGWFVTRQVVAASQLLMSGLLIHVGDGRIEMHFHVFGSLAFLAFYRDWRVLITATIVVAADHILRGLYLPLSVYGVATPTLLRSFEHAGWVVFEDIFLIASCIQGVREMRRIANNRALLECSYRDVEKKVQERTQQLKDAQQDLLKVARSAGMAEIAISVLHNVGNVLNSVNVSANLVADRLRQSEVASLAKVGEMFREHKPDLAEFLTSNERGKLIPDFVDELATCLGEEQKMMLAEVSTLASGIDHIKQIVAAQQSLAKKSNMQTPVQPVKVMETALIMQSTTHNSGIEIVRRFGEIPEMQLDQHRILQILINLISNATQSLKSSGNTQPKLTVSVERVASELGTLIRFGVADNGVGIKPEHLTRIFSHGFTTKSNGHGFGLHGAANTAGELGGKLTAASAGPGMGAVFNLDLPVASREMSATCN